MYITINTALNAVLALEFVQSMHLYPLIIMYTCTCIYMYFVEGTLYRYLVRNLFVQKKTYTYVLCLSYTCSLFEEEISRMNPQAIVPPQPLQPAPSVGEYMYTMCIHIFSNEIRSCIIHYFIVKYKFVSLTNFCHPKVWL